MTAVLYLLLLQGLMGAFDTLWYHEYKQQLPRDVTAKVELRLHASRDFAYAIVFGSLGWVLWHGAWSWPFIAILAFEIGITLWDFVEEDLTRRLPAGERVMHTLMAIVYGAFLACLVPQILLWMRQPPALVPVYHGWLSWVFSFFALGVALSGVRDIHASFTSKPGTRGFGSQSGGG